MANLARFGSARWGAERWAETDGGAAHILSANIGSVLDAYAKRLGANHPLAASLRSELIAVGIGMGPAPIHPLRSFIVTSLDVVDAPALSFQHVLSSAIITSFTANPAGLRMSHKLSAGLVSSLDVTGHLKIYHRLAAVIATKITASARDLDLSHPLSARIVTSLDAAARYKFEMPQLVPLEEINPSDPDAYVAGTINLAANPSVENDLLGWHAENGATVSRVLGPAQDGLYSGRFMTPGAISTERGVIRSFADLKIAPWPGSYVWVEGWASAQTPIVLRVWPRVTYLDGSVVEGEIKGDIDVTSTGLLGAWDSFISLPFQPDAEKVILYIDLMIAPDAPSGISQWNVDGAYIEYDPWNYGPKGAPYPVLAPIIEEEGELPIIEEPEV